MLDNESLYVDPYIASLIPPILTCLLGHHLGPPPYPDLQATLPLRQLAASLTGLVAKKYAKSSHTLRPRLARTCLQHFLTPTKPFGSNYGGIIGLQAVGDGEAVRALILPNLKDYGELLRDALEGTDEVKSRDAETVLRELVKAASWLEGDSLGATNGFSTGDAEAMNEKLREKVGGLIAERIIELRRPKLVKAIVGEQFT